MCAQLCFVTGACKEHGGLAEIAAADFTVHTLPSTSSHAELLMQMHTQIVVQTWLFGLDTP
jgi:hypothetical protein